MRRRPRFGLCAALAAALAGAVAAATVGSLVARSTDSDQVGDNSFGTASSFPGGCTVPRVSDVLRGSLTSTSNGTQTVTLPRAVDPAQAFLLFTSRHNSSTASGSLVRGDLTSPSTLEFTRNTSTAPSITIEWSVVEYECGVKVQRGSTNLSSTNTSTNQGITAVSGLDRAFVTSSWTTASNDGTFDDADNVVADLSSTTNVEFQTGESSAGKVVSWQVVEMVPPVDVKVQRLTIYLWSGQTQGTVDIPTPVDMGRTMLVSRFGSLGGTSTDIGGRLPTAELTSPTTVTVRRAVAGNNTIIGMRIQVVELLDGSTVRRGSTAFSQGTAMMRPALAAVDLRRATATSTISNGAGQSSGRSPYTSNDITGVSSFTTELAAGANGLTLRRNNTAASADVAWEVVEWGPP